MVGVKDGVEVLVADGVNAGVGIVVGDNPQADKAKPKDVAPPTFIKSRLDNDLGFVIATLLCLMTIIITLSYSPACAQCTPLHEPQPP